MSKIANMKHDTDDDYPVYLTNKREHAERVLTDVHWYNSGLKVPQLGQGRDKISANDLEIVEVTLTF